MANTDAVVLTLVDKEEREKHVRPWSDLPSELLSLILSHLFGGDCVYFRLICKSWESISAANRLLPPPKHSSLSQSPCLMFSDNQMFHPIYNDMYQMDIANNVPGAIIRDSKYGWFLMTQGFYHIFFFNPITKVRINLPHILENNLIFACMQFSFPPTSLECKVTGFTSVLNDKVTICTIKRNKNSWTIHEFSQQQSFTSSNCNPILYHGVYYCLGSEGNLIIYDPNKNRCDWTSHDKSLRKQLSAMYHHSYMVESGGKLLAVFVARDGSWVGVFRLNLSLMVFERVHSLGNKMLFVSQAACFSETTIVRGAGNKIFLPKFHGKNGMFYSLDTKKFHSFAGDYFADNFYEAKGYPRGTWIKPIFDSYCVEEFNW